MNKYCCVQIAKEAAPLFPPQSVRELVDSGNTTQAGKQKGRGSAKRPSRPLGSWFYRNFEFARKDPWGLVGGPPLVWILEWHSQ